MAGKNIDPDKAALANKKVNALDKVAHRLLTTIDTSFNEREVLNAKDRRIQEIIDSELTLAQGVSQGSIIDFVTTMTSNKVSHQSRNTLGDVDPSEVFTKDLSNIFGYFQEQYKNRYIELADLKFITKFIPAIGEAIKTTLDAIVGSDDMTTTITRNLVLNDALSPEEKARVTSEIERIETEEKLLKKLRNVVYKKTLIAGTHYVYCPPYAELFQEYDRLLKAGVIKNGIIVNNTETQRKATGVGKNSGFNLDNNTILAPVKEAVSVESIMENFKASEIFDKKELDAFKKNLEAGGLSITTNESPFLDEAIESIAALEKYDDMYMQDLSGYATAFGGIGALNEDINRTSDGIMDPNAKGSKFNTVGTYIKYIDASRIVPVKVYNQIVGYFHVHDMTASKKMRNMNDTDNMLIGSVNLFANINMNDNKKESAVRMITDVISDGILSNFSNRFVNNNQDFKKLIADCIVANGMINNNLNIQFIPASHIIPFIVNENEEGFGESVLADSLFPARLLLDLLISKLLLYMNKSGNRTLAFVRKGPIDVGSANHIQRVLRQLQEANITFGDLLSTNLSFAKFAPYGNLQIPTARNGDRLVDFEIQEGQQVDLKPELEDWLEKTAIMGTGVPSVILEYTDAADYAKSLVTANIKFAGRVATFQSDLEEPTTELYKRLIQNSSLDDNLKKKAIAGFKFSLPRPRVISNANMSDYLGSMQQVAQTLADLYLGQDDGSDPDAQKVRNVFIRNTVIDHLPIIDWKAAQERLENAKLEVIEKKKLKDNMGNVDDAANDNLDDSLLDDNELL